MHIWFNCVLNFNPNYKNVTMDFLVWFQIAFVCMLGAISPGPSLAIIVNNATTGGRCQGVMASIGHGFGVGIYAFSAVTGLAFLLVANPGLISIINWAGALFLAGIGLKLFHSGSVVKKKAVVDVVPNTRRGFAEGFIIAFVNPKIAAFFLVLFSQFIRPDVAWSEQLILTFTAGIIDMSWYIIVSLVLTGDTAFNWLNRRSKMLNKFLGITLLIIAAGILFRG